DAQPRATAHPPQADRISRERPNQGVVTNPQRKSLAELYALSDYSGALKEAETRLKDDPNDLEAQRGAQDCRRVLIKMQLARLGSLQQVVRLAVEPERLQWLSIDHRAGFVLSLVD